MLSTGHNGKCPQDSNLKGWEDSVTLRYAVLHGQIGAPTTDAPPEEDRASAGPFGSPPTRARTRPAPGDGSVPSGGTTAAARDRRDPIPFWTTQCRSSVSPGPPQRDPENDGSLRQPKLESVINPLLEKVSPRGPTPATRTTAASRGSSLKTGKASQHGTRLRPKNARSMGLESSINVASSPVNEIPTESEASFPRRSLGLGILYECLHP